MERKISRLLSLLLCCVMLVGLLPVMALAARDDSAYIEVNKADVDGNPLAGATFVLLVNEDDIAGEVAYEATSNADGVAAFTAVAPGSYILAESAAPEGYVKSETTYSLYITEDGRVILFTGEMPNGIDYSPVTFVNEAEPAPVTVSISVNKVDQEGNPLAGALFVLNVDEDGVAGEAAYEAVSDEQGVATFTGVVSGSYILEESTAPEGYVKSGETYSLYVAEDGRVVLFTEEMPNGMEYTPVTFVNEAEPAPVTVSISVNKVDQEGNPLAGAVFTLRGDRTLDGEAARDYEAVSNEQGVAAFTDVVSGSYILEESTAPEGYVKSGETYSLYVAEDGRVVLFTEEMPNGTEYTAVTFVNEAAPEDPTDSTEPEQPTEPTQPEQPTEPAAPADSDNPKTGDGSPLLLWGVLVLASGIAVTMLLEQKKRHI